MAFFFVCLFLLLCTHLLQDLAGSEGINPSSLNRGFLGCRSAITAADIVAIITLAIIIVFKTTKQGDPTERGTTGDEFNNGSTFRDEVYQCFPMSEFAAATHNFSDYNILYKGVYTIYRGAHLPTSKVPSQSDNYLSIIPYDTLQLSHGSHLSTYKPPSSIIYKGVYLPNDSNKFGHISHLSHPNLAHMLGYSCSNRETVVGYKIEGARLLLHLLRNYNISWLERLNICIGVAEALRCLHTARIIHGGISPTTIFLDNSSSAKLVTFGSVLSQLSNAKQTEETDVHLFGFLLLILLCDKELDVNGYRIHLPNKVYKAVKDKTLYKITGLRLAEVGNESLYEFLVVAFNCINPQQVVRPNMDGVVEGLKKARALQMRGL